MASTRFQEQRQWRRWRRNWAVVLAGIAALVLIGCSSPPPVAEFSTTNDSGNAPLDISFILGETVDGESFSWDFGDGNGSDEPEPDHTFQDAGTFTVRLTVSKGERFALAETTITVEPGEAGWIVIEGVAESVSSLGTVQFNANAFDALGNPIAGQEFSWSADAAAGDIDEAGLFTAGTDLGNFANAISVEFERLGATASQKVGIAIVEGPMHAISIEPNELDIGVGRDLPISVRAVDEAGHVLDSALVLFTALRQDDTVDSSGLFTASIVASAEDSELLSVEVELDDQIIKATVSGVVRPGILDQVHVSSLPTNMDAGESVQVMAFATDRFGNELDLDELVWTVTEPRIGSVTESGLFTAGTAAGTYVEEGLTVRGILSRVEAVTTAPVTINPGPAVSISIVPDGDSVPIGAGSPFTVVAYDAHGNLLETAHDDYEYEYSIAGRGNETAVFIAGYELGDFENAITVKLPSGVAGNADELVAQSDINIRQRSSNIAAIEIVDQDGGIIMLIDLETATFGPADLGFVDNGAVELSPSWWPDGSRLVYISSATGSLQAYTLDLTTQEIVQLTNTDAGVSMPEISPDGKSIVFVDLEGEAWQLYVAPVPDDAASNPITLAGATRVSVDDTAQHILPHWSPDGSQLLVSVNTLDGRVRMTLFDPTLTDEPQSIGPFGTVGFGWAADGSGVHFGVSTADGALELGTLDLATGIPAIIESSLDFLVAAWAPDDSELMAIDSVIGAAWFLDSDNTGLRRAVDSDQFPTRISWRPREYGDPVANPDPEGLQRMLEAGDSPAPPVGALDTGVNYSAVISTELGDISIDLFDDLAPMTVENFINLARIGFYDGSQFHRVVSGFISQAGEPSDGGSDGPGYTFNDELSRGLSHDSAGVVSMANAGANTNGSQFFITQDAAIELDAYDANTKVKKNCADDAISCHSIFGVVTDGVEIVTGMTERDPATATTPGLTILSILIVEN
ncbi:MAG: peptidylprolyl isomerase [Chloroflexi bacterium]|nr:peptidylprolyl isomerase [Chloroflexota bacterium]